MHPDNFHQFPTQNIEIGSLVDSSLLTYVQEHFGSSRIIILVDENTHESCFEFLLTSFTEIFSEAEVITLPAGEENKCIEICVHVWEAMNEYQIKRNDLLINLGGGMITDMGGFIASLYKRGITFINIPTSLLAMVDASLGGKTGVDLGSSKNMIGVFTEAEKVYIDPIFLQTLPDEELLNGYAEIIKHALIADSTFWSELQDSALDLEAVNTDLLARAIAIKADIVAADPKELGARKKLNFGHTWGHAIEGYFLDKEPVAHGHAVAVGMVLEAYLSKQKGLLSPGEFQEIASFLLKKYPPIDLVAVDFDQLYALMLQDKKNTDHAAVSFVLLESIGAAVIHQNSTYDEIRASYHFYTSLLEE